MKTLAAPDTFAALSMAIHDVASANPILTVAAAVLLTVFAARWLVTTLF